MVEEMGITSESDEMMMLDSPSPDDAKSGRNFGGNSHLKKGPWTSVEDAILVEYVTKHGEGNWNAVQKHSGLARCGKSCRLRWANHLRPDLKKGAFTPEEERRIIELHAKIGNKWARMAAELPGRTDNEIKNYWNTRIKRRERAGLPIYPPDLCLQASNENQLIDDMNAFSSGDMHHPDIFPINNFEIPSFDIKNLELNQQLYPPAVLDISISSLLDIPARSLLTQRLHPSYPNTCLVSRVHQPKRFRGSESACPGLNAHHITEPYGLSSAYDNNSNSNHGSCSSVLTGTHAAINGDPSSSEPAWAMKLELPSLQTQTGSWGGGSPSSSPLPSLESVDTLIQTPASENVHSCSLSPRNSGLLDAVLYESQTMGSTNNNTGLTTSSHASHMIVDEMDETEWEGYGKPVSPLGHSTASVLSEGTPVTGNSVDEFQSVQHTTGCKVQEASGLVPVQRHSNTETPNGMIFYRPDLMLGSSNYFFPGDHTKLKDTSSTRNAMSTI